MAKNGTLPPKRQRFVDEYLVDHNGAQAAARAGYSPVSAKVTASRLLTDANAVRPFRPGSRRRPDRQV
jgi:phage terminase small subunit